MSESSHNSVTRKVSNDSGEHVCTECKAVFTSSYYMLRRHVKKYHKDKVDEIAPLKHPERSFGCVVCGKKFKYNKHLTYHKRSHEVLSDSTYNKPHATTTDKSGKKCPLCNYKESSKTQLCNHFNEVHDVKMSVEELEFATKKDFEVWKNLTERSSKSKFVKEYGDLMYETHETLSFICYRSGFYVSKGQKKRHLKTQGSCKIDGFCPSGMKVKVNTNGQCHVTYNKTHVGHTVNLAHLNLKTAEREEIAKKIALKGTKTGITKDENLYIHTDDIKVEVESLHRSLATASSTDPPTDNTLQETKEEMRRWMDTVLDSIQSHPQMALLKKLIAPIEPTLKAAASKPSVPVRNAVQVPYNKKIDKQ